jgi:membrane protease YdiL (CAAX protease family)
MDYAWVGSNTLLNFGIGISLLGWPLVLLACRLPNRDTLSFVPRLFGWVLAALCVVLAATISPSGISSLGVRPVSIETLILGVGTAVGTLLLFAAIGFIQRAMGLPGADIAMFARVTALTPLHKLFLVVTAGVTEEILYRGYAIGLGQALFGSVWVAASLSLLVFTLAHLNWRTNHLISVAGAGGAVTVVFVLSRDLAACILAHTLVDGVAVALMPSYLRRWAKLRKEGVDDDVDK